VHTLTFVIKSLLKHQNQENSNGYPIPEEIAQKVIL